MGTHINPKKNTLTTEVTEKDKNIKEKGRRRGNGEKKN